jgi:RNA polymerase sigma-70 factor (ECF subfamily)
LIAQAASGAHDALAALFELHSAHVHRVAYRLTMSSDDADDIVQDLFLGLPEAIATALLALPDDLRVVFMLRDVEGYSHSEIAALLGIRSGTAEVRLHRARRKLRALLGDR